MGWIVAIILALMLAGQLAAATADYFLAVENPRPVSGRTLEFTSRAWGFIIQNHDARFVAGSGGPGLSDVRVFQTPRQAFVTMVRFGFVRQVGIAYRFHAGSLPRGEA